MEISVHNLQKKIPIKTNQIFNHIRKILRYLKLKKVKLSITFVTDQRIKSLNKKFLHRDHTTDVLAFDLTEENLSRLGGKIHRVEGEIVVSTDTVWKNAKQFGTQHNYELMLCVVHGILHLLGYDDHLPEDIEKMRKKEKDVMRLLKFGN